VTYRYRFLITEYIFDSDYLFDTLSHNPVMGYLKNHQLCWQSHFADWEYDTKAGRVFV